jgi:hypothetical protein
MEKSAFPRVNLSDVRVIMATMRVFMVKSLCQSVMGWVLVLECLLLGTRLRLVMSSIKWHCYPRSQLQWCLSGTGEPPGVTADGLGMCRANCKEL